MLKLLKNLKKILKQLNKPIKTEERRRHQRYSRLSSRKFIIKFQKKNKVLGQVKDFSRSGISFYSDVKPSKLRKIKVFFEISGLEKKIPAIIKVLRRVPSQQGYFCAARLIDIYPDNKFEILDLLYKDWRKSLK